MLSALAAASRRRPLAMSTLTAFGVVATGDALVQAVREPSINPRRSLVPASYSGLLAPIYVVWWRWLDVRFPGTGLSVVLKKAMANQLVTSLPNNVGYMAWCTYWLEDGSREGIGTRLRTELPSIVGAAFSFWMPMNAINFAWVPMHHRILFMSVANCAWAGWLSNAVNGENKAAIAAQKMSADAFESVVEAAAVTADATLGGCMAAEPCRAAPS